MLNNTKFVKIFLPIAIILIIIGFGFLVWLSAKPYSKGTDKIPEYFLAEGGDQTVFTATDIGNLPLRPTEAVDKGVKYEAAKPMLKAVEEYVQKMKDNSWVAIGGSSQTATTTMLKLNNGKETLLITFKQIQPDRTEIIVLPIIKR